MKFLNLSIPRRLQYIRISICLALLISFLLSWNLWSNNAYYPDQLLVPSLQFLSPFSGFITVASILSLLVSVLHKNHRLFLLIALSLNILLVLLDYNRLQSWFFIYNALLFVLLFYNGRVDNSTHFIFIFICLQIIPASVYFFNGISQLNPNFYNTDLYSTLSTLHSHSSERQFAYFMKAGRIVPFVLIFLSLALLIRPTRFLAIPLALIFHFLLLFLLFPSERNSNAAIWLMNLTFSILTIFLFAGNTQDRYFSNSILLQKPLFYLVFFCFFISPAFQFLNIWENAPKITFRNGHQPKSNPMLNEEQFKQLPLYVRHFCKKNEDRYEIRISDWCRHELRSDPVAEGIFLNKNEQSGTNIAIGDVKESEDELSSL
jgi:hypothetical protein